MGEKGLIVNVSPVVSITAEVIEQCPPELRHLLGSQVLAVIAFTPSGQAISVKGVCVRVTKDFLVVQRVDLLDHPIVTLNWQRVMHVEMTPQVGQ